MAAAAPKRAASFSSPISLPVFREGGGAAPARRHGVGIAYGASVASPSPQSKSAVADFDRFVEWPKPAYTRFRLGEGRGGGSGGCGNAVPPLTTPTPNPSPQGGEEEFAALLRRKLAPTRVTAAAKAARASVLFVLDPIRRSCLHMLPPARSCVVRLWALFATRSPVCSVSATDSKCIQTTLDYTDGGGIRAALGRRDKRRGAH